MFEATSVQAKFDEIGKQWNNSTLFIDNKGSVNQVSDR